METQDVRLPAVFHLALHVSDLDLARHFYGEVLGCEEGRRTDTWVDFNFFGHQLSLHVGKPWQTSYTGLVGGKQVPMPHFGLAMHLPQWQELARRLSGNQDVQFVLEPQVRFEGQPGEQWTMFFLDPFGNPIEIKGFASFDDLYAA